jgi:hypothetical protein
MQLAPAAVRLDGPTLLGIQQKPDQKFIYVTEMDGTGGYLKRAGGDPKAALEQALAAAKELSAGDAPAAMVFQGPGEDSVFDVYVGRVGIADTHDAGAADVRPYVLAGGEEVLSPFALAIVDGEQQAKLVELGP